MENVLNFIFGLTAIGLLPFFGLALFRMFFVQVEDETEILITQFGKIHKIINRAGAHFCPTFLPWIHVVKVSKKRDFRHYKELFMNDSRGATMIVDLWTEIRVVDSTLALFAVEDWEKSLFGLTVNTASTLLSAHQFQFVHTNRKELGEKLKEELTPVAQKWGIEIDNIFIRQIRPLPEVSRQMFTAVAAKLERFKTRVEEEGRIDIARLEADTNVQVASLKSLAKSQYPLAVGRAYRQLAQTPAILKAYCQLYDLGQRRPHRTISFQGFSADQLTELDAVMASTSSSGSSSGGAGAGETFAN